MAKWSLGKLSKPFLWVALVWNSFIVVTLVGPYYFPVSAETFNYAPVIWGAVTIFAVVAYLLTPESKWLSRARIQNIRDNEAYRSDSSSDATKVAE